MSEERQAEHLPVALVRIDSPLPQLDRVFDYAVPPGMDAVAQPGVRVRVRFAGRLLSGFIVGRSATSSVTTPLRPLERVVSPEIVLTPSIARLVERVAVRNAGTFSDVVRAAVPPRHARAESAIAPPASGDGSSSPTVPTLPSTPDGPMEAWQAYAHGAALIERLRSQRTAGLRAVWSLAPARRWTNDVVAAVLATRSSGAGVIVVVPDGTDVERLTIHLRQALATGAVTGDAMGDTGKASDPIAVLTADLGPQRRYMSFLRILRGHARIVIGTRAAVFAPVHDLGAVILWDDDDDSLWDPHAPYWNARDVAALRSADEGCAVLVGSASRSLVAEQWCATGWARSLAATRSTVRAVGPRVIGVPDEAMDGPTGRLPRVAWEIAKQAVTTGPVLVQVAQPGYLPRVACASCRHLASCTCGGPLALDAAGAPPRCVRCGLTIPAWACAHCADVHLRAVRVGAERTAAEFGRAFPEVPVVWSQGASSIRRIDDQPAIVVATAGVEPWAEQGYAAVLILDARRQLQRASLRAGEEAARRWFQAACLARPGAAVVIDADPATWAVQALLRWDAAWLARRELAERESAHLTPAVRTAVFRGAAADVTDLLAGITVPPRVVRVADDRWVASVDRRDGATFARDVHRWQAMRTARHTGAPVHVMFDPREPLIALTRPEVGGVPS